MRTLISAENIGPPVWEFHFNQTSDLDVVLSRAEERINQYSERVNEHEDDITDLLREWRRLEDTEKKWGIAPIILDDLAKARESAHREYKKLSSVGEKIIKAYSKLSQNSEAPNQVYADRGHELGKQIYMLAQHMLDIYENAYKEIKNDFDELERELRSKNDGRVTSPKEPKPRNRTLDESDAVLRPKTKKSREYLAGN